MSKSPHERRTRGRRERIQGVRTIRQRFLIVCEGEQTEPNYFKAFQVAGLVLEVKGVASTSEGNLSG